jgi:hypothetical protein
LFGQYLSWFDRASFSKALHRLAASNVFVGTSSWKYKGWFGQIYEKSRYEWSGKFAESRFNRDCLSKYLLKNITLDNKGDAATLTLNPAQ